MRRLIILGILFGSPLPGQNREPRVLPHTDVRIGTTVMTVSGVTELRNGRLIISDAMTPGVWLINPETGEATLLGSVGADITQYVQPGGFYAGRADTTHLLDRGQSRFLVIAPGGTPVTSRSIKRRGFSSSSSEDRDFQRLDARGMAYFTEMRRGPQLASGAEVTDTAMILRLDASTQHIDTIAPIRQPLRRVLQASANMTSSQMQYGAPIDDWGVAPDGSVAVVRARPYRVEWYGRTGEVTRGPAYTVPQLPFSKAERDSLSRNVAGSGGTASVGASDDRASASSSSARWIAETKPPFLHYAVMVAPDKHVWVRRESSNDAKGVTYDVFDDKGVMVDRVQLETASRIVGFGRRAVYAVLRDARGVVVLRKYRLS